MVVKLNQLLEGFGCRPGATDVEIAKTSKELGLRLPEEYVEFLKISNGGEGAIGRAGFANLWSIEELASLNRAYEVQKYVPGLLLFGSNGGGEAFGFDTRTSPWPIVEIPFVGMEWTAAEFLGNSFMGFLRRLYRLK